MDRLIKWGKLPLEFAQYLYYKWLLLRTDGGVFHYKGGYVLAYHHLDSNVVYILVTAKDITYVYKDKRRVKYTNAPGVVVSPLYRFVNARYEHVKTPAIEKCL